MTQTTPQRTASDDERQRVYGILRSSAQARDLERAHAAMRWLFGRGTPGEAVSAASLIARAFPDHSLDPLFARATEAFVAARDYSYDDAPTFASGRSVHLPRLSDLERDPAFTRLVLRTSGVPGHRLEAWGAKKMKVRVHEIVWSGLDWAQREVWWAREDPVGWLERQGGVTGVDVPDVEGAPDESE